MHPLKPLLHMKKYAAPQLTDYGDIAELTATLGEPFTGDTSYDVDGDVLGTGLNSVNQCPTTNNEACLPVVP
jgi:hypothetical protein